MVVKKFPPVDSADEYGFLCAGGDLEPESLLLAYRTAIFPWPIADEELITWFSPPRRALLFLNEAHVSKSLQKEFRRGRFEVRINTRFGDVMAGCADRRKEIQRGAQAGTWITEEMQEAYLRLHLLGHAHSIETFLEDQLVGGLYGVSIGGFFAGESMFYKESNASKVALIALVEHLRARGVPWIDCQVMTPLFKTFGAREVRRADYLKLLAVEAARNVTLFPAPPGF